MSYMSILPGGPGIEHSTGGLLALNPIYFDPQNIVKLAMERACNAVALTRAAYFAPHFTVKPLS